MNEAVSSAQALCRARTQGERLAHARVQPADRAQAYAIQDQTLAVLGPIGGWKVGAKGPAAEPTCAPLPAAGLLPEGVTLQGPAWQLRGIESEVAFVLGRDLPARAEPYTRADVEAALEAVLPVIEVVETRLEDWLGAHPNAQLADLLSHGALILGPRQPFDPRWLDLSRQEVVQSFDGQSVAHTLSGHPAPDVGALLAWLANHSLRRGPGLKAGQILTTGSCTGMLFASQGAQVRAEVRGLGTVSLSFRAARPAAARGSLRPARP